MKHYKVLTSNSPYLMFPGERTLLHLVSGHQTWSRKDLVQDHVAFQVRRQRQLHGDLRGRAGGLQRGHKRHSSKQTSDSRQRSDQVTPPLETLTKDVQSVFQTYSFLKLFLRYVALNNIAWMFRCLDIQSSHQIELSYASLLCVRIGNQVLTYNLAA